MKAHFRGGPQDGATLHLMESFPEKIIYSTGFYQLEKIERKTSSGGENFITEDAFYLWKSELP